jgi:CubicO group peptidase (beta-lactamase class C family)
VTRSATTAIAELADECRRRTGAPAIGVALVPATGEPTVVVRGERIRGGGDPVETGDRWHIGSCMKAMTAAATARFVERGRLHWSTPVAELFDAGTADPGWLRIPVADVLTHTAGVPANPTAAQLRAGLTDPAPLTLQRARLAQHVLAAPPAGPGRFRYSNLGYVLAGAALERLAGSAFEDVLAAEVLRPLGITSAGFGAPGPGQPRGHRARRSVLGIGLGRGPAIDPGSASGGGAPPPPPPPPAPPRPAGPAPAAAGAGPRPGHRPRQRLAHPPARQPAEPVPGRPAAPEPARLVGLRPDLSRRARPAPERRVPRPAHHAPARRGHRAGDGLVGAGAGTAA